MLKVVSINPANKTVTLTDITIANPDFFNFIESQPETKRQQAVLDVIAVGSAAMQRVQSQMDADFVEKRFADLVLKFSRSLDTIHKTMAEEIGKRFSPTESGSYVKAITDVVKSAKDDLTSKSCELQGLLDPERKGSAVGQLENLVEKAATQFEGMFDPDVNGSYANRLNKQLEVAFGTDGRPGSITAAMEAALKPVLADLRELKEKVEARKAAEQIIAASSLKGRPFEDFVHASLAELARPYGDDVAAVGNGNGGCRAGDFLIAVNETGKRIVVEARNRKQFSLPAIKGELEREMSERAADFAMYVSSGTEMLPQHVGEFQIYEDKLITTAENLPIAYRVARLITLSEAPDGETDLGALLSTLSKIRDAARSLRDMKSKASQVKNLAERIHSDAGSTEETILDLLAEAEELIGTGKSA